MGASSTAPIRVLWVDDGPVVADSLEGEDDRLTVEVATSGREARRRLENGEQFDCIVTEYDVGDVDGIDLLRTVRAEDPDRPFILFTASGSEAIASEAISAGVTDYLCKDGDDQYATLAETIRIAVEANWTPAEHQHKRLLDALFEFSPIHLFVKDTDGRHLWTSSQLYDDPGDVIGRTDKDLESYATEAFAAEAYADDMRVIETGERIIDKVDYNETLDKWFLSSKVPWRDEDGTIIGLLGYSFDVTEQKELEAELRTFKRIVERIDDPIMLQDRDGNFKVVNEAVERYAGLTSDQLRGRDESAFMDETTAERIDEMKQRAIETRQPVEYEVSPEFPTVGERSFSTVRYPQYDEDGQLSGTVAICRDVTELVEHERQFRVMERVLRHNLRNDIQVIEGTAETIREASTDRITEHAEQIIETSEQLLETVDQEREITKFLSEPPPTTRLDLVSVVESVIAIARDAEPAANVTTDLPESCHVVASEMIREAIRELVENAIVHADSETPSVNVSLHATAETVAVSVADDGPGIPEMERNILTGDEEIDPLYHGTGMGLWIVNLIVRHAGGVLTFDENDPRGSVVTIRLPSAE